jgi:hypothetical protein
MRPINISVVLLVLGLFFSVNSAYSQDTLLLLNGKKYPIKVKKVTNDSITFEPIGKEGKEKQIEKIDVFSLISPNGNELVMYRQDTNAGNNLSVDQMRNYIYGEQDARKNYHAPLMAVAGLIAGAGGGFVGFYGLMVPPLATALLCIKSPKVKAKNVSKPELITNDYYTTGFQSIAVRKKVKNGMIGGLLGFALTSATITIMKSNGMFK